MDRPEPRLQIEELTSETLTPEVLAEIRELLIQDWQKVDGVSNKDARRIMEEHGTLGNVDAMRKILATTATKLCKIVDSSTTQTVAAAMVGERKYGDEEGYVHTPAGRESYRQQRAAYKSALQETGRRPDPTESSIFAWGVLDDYEETALRSLLGWMEDKYPTTKRAVVDIDTGDTRLSEAAEAVNGESIGSDAPTGEIAFGANWLTKLTKIHPKLHRLGNLPVLRRYRHTGRIVHTFRRVELTYPPHHNIGDE